MQVGYCSADMSSSSSCRAISTDIPRNRSFLPVGPQGYTSYPHRAAVCRCELAALLLLGLVKGFHRSTSLIGSSLLLQQCPIFVAASHQTRLDTRSKARRPIKVGIKGRGRSGTSRDSNPACLCCSSAHLVQCEPDEASSFTNPNVSPGTYASLRLKLDAWSSAVQRGQKCSSPTRRLPSRSWGPIRPRVCSWFRAPIRHECQTAQLKSRGRAFSSSVLHL